MSQMRGIIMRNYVTYSYHRTQLRAELALVEALDSGMIAECERPKVVAAGREYAIRVLDLAVALEGAE
jgi:hypothetical protein